MIERPRQMSMHPTNMLPTQWLSVWFPHYYLRAPTHLLDPGPLQCSSGSGAMPSLRSTTHCPHLNGVYPIATLAYVSLLPDGRSGGGA